jgi:hypothetical protein
MVRVKGVTTLFGLFGVKQKMNTKKRRKKRAKYESQTAKNRKFIVILFSFLREDRTFSVFIGLNL